MICNYGRKCIESFVWVLWEKLQSHFNLLMTWICFCYTWEKSKNFIWHLHKKHLIIIPGHHAERFWAQELTFSISLLLTKTSPAKLHKCVYYTVSQLNCDISLKVLPRSTSGPRGCRDWHHLWIHWGFGLFCIDDNRLTFYRIANV